MCDLPMWKAFQRYRELDPEARKLFWRAAVLLASVGVSLRTKGFRRTSEKLRKNLLTAPKEAVVATAWAESVERTCRMVKAGARYGWGHPTCLEQSLVLWYLLQRQKIPARFRIGVRKDKRKFEAHAWVEYEGRPLNQEMHEHYAAFEGELSDLPEEIA